jgi:hypothetical protein
MDSIGMASDLKGMRYQDPAAIYNGLSRRIFRQTRLFGEHKPNCDHLAVGSRFWRNGR